MKTKRILIEVGYSDEAELAFIKRAIENLSRCYQLAVVCEVEPPGAYQMNVQEADGRRHVIGLPVRVASEDRPAITQPVKVLT